MEVQTGWDLDSFALYLPSVQRLLGESDAYGAIGGPSELYAVQLGRVDLVSVAGVPAAELTDKQLVKACLLPASQGDVVALVGCPQLRDMSCLAKLEQMQALDVSGCANVNAASLAIAIKRLL